MALVSVEFFGDAIQKCASLLAVVPDGPGPFPVLYLLHGLSDNHTIWLRRTSVERYAAQYRLMLVMPDGHRSFYVDDPRPGGLAYARHIVEDVVGFVDRVFPTVRAREGRALAGLSMGGYGAVMLALRHPDRFAAAVSHSGALQFAHQPRPERPDFEALAAALPHGAFDCFALAAALPAGGPRPALRLDCGVDDFLLEPNRAFHAHLAGRGYAHEYAEHPGAHTWEYWDEHVRETLAFVAGHLPGALPPRRVG